MKFYVILIFITLFSVNCISGESDVDFRHNLARQAQKKYNETIVKAKTQFYKDLQKALESSLKSADLDSANQIKEVLDTLKLDISNSKNSFKIVGTWLNVDKKEVGLIIRDDFTYEFKNVKTNEVWHSGKVEISKNEWILISSDGKKITICEKDGCLYRPDNSIKYTREKVD